MNATTTDWAPTDELRNAGRLAARERSALLSRLVLLVLGSRPQDIDTADDRRADRVELAVGDVAVTWSHGRWRFGVVTKTTRAKITVAVMTPTGLDDAEGRWHGYREMTRDAHAHATRRGEVVHQVAMAERDRMLALVDEGEDALVARGRADLRRWLRKHNLSETTARVEQAERASRSTYAWAMGWLARNTEDTARRKADKAYTEALSDAIAARQMIQRQWAVLAPVTNTARNRTEVFKARTQF
jgi:hypothetical protein